MVTLDETTATEEQYQLATYKKMPVVAERGEGVWIYASNGDRYLDLYGGAARARTGHCPPHVGEGIRQQTRKRVFFFTPGFLGGGAPPAGRFGAGVACSLPEPRCV